MSAVGVQRCLFAGVLGVALAVVLGFVIFRAARVPFTISGNVAVAMSPGVMVPLDVTFDNHNAFSITVTGLDVSVRAVDAPHADTDHPCDLTDYAVEQVQGAVRIVVGPHRADSLSGMRIPARDWPRVGLRGLPGLRSGCRGATLTLAYAASRALKIT